MSELSHVNAQVVALISIVSTPDLLEQLPVRNDSAGVPYQGSKQLVFGWGEVRLFVGPEDLPAHQVDSELTRLEDGLRRGAWGEGRVSESYANSRQEL